MEDLSYFKSSNWILLFYESIATVCFLRPCCLCVFPSQNIEICPTYKGSTSLPSPHINLSPNSSIHSQYLGGGEERNSALFKNSPEGSNVLCFRQQYGNSFVSGAPIETITQQYNTETLE